MCMLKGLFSSWNNLKKFYVSKCVVYKSTSIPYNFYFESFFPTFPLANKMLCNVLQVTVYVYFYAIGFSYKFNFKEKTTGNFLLLVYRVLSFAKRRGKRREREKWSSEYSTQLSERLELSRIQLQIPNRNKCKFSNFDNRTTRVYYCIRFG